MEEHQLISLIPLVQAGVFYNEFLHVPHFVKQLISDFSRMYSDHLEYHILISLHPIVIASSFPFLSSSHCSPHCGSSHAISSHIIVDHTITNFLFTTISPFQQTSLLAAAPRRSHCAAGTTLSEPLKRPHIQRRNTRGPIHIGPNSHQLPQLPQSPYTRHTPLHLPFNHN